MFAKLRMSVNDTIKEFHKICCEVYIGDLSPSARTQKLRDCVEDLLRRRGLPVDLKLGKDDRVAEQGCPWYVIERRNTKSSTDIYCQFRHCNTQGQHEYQGKAQDLSQSH